MSALCLQRYDITIDGIRELERVSVMSQVENGSLITPTKLSQFSCPSFKCRRVGTSWYLPVRKANECVCV